MMESKFKERISSSEKNKEKISKGAYDGLSVEEIKKRMIFGGEEGEVDSETPLESWCRRYGYSREEVLAKWPEKFNPDGSFKS